MEDLPQEIRLTRVADGVAAPANLVELTRALAKSQIDGKWWTLPGVGKSRRKQENDHGWDWHGRVGQLGNDRWFEAAAIQTLDGQVQGAMIYRINAKSFVDESVGAIHIEGLATAPRNRGWLVEQPEFRGVGTALVARAALRSYQLGFAGRVNLIAFEDERTIEFYQKRGFEIVGQDGDDDEQKLPMLELNPAEAMQLLTKAGYLP